MPAHDLLIVGAGPSGLATAIAAKQRGLDYVLVDKGVLVNSIFHFPTHMVFFTTPELLEIGGLPLVTPYDKPTRLEALRYYRRVVDTYALQIGFHQRVVHIARDGDAFTVTTELQEAPIGATTGAYAGTGIVDAATSGGEGERRTYRARAVVLAIGYYDIPNRLDVPGEGLPHVSHYFTDAHPYYRQRVVVVGGRNSAAEAALELYRAGAHVTLVHRGVALGGTIKYWVRPDIENRLKEGAIAGRLGRRVVEIRRDSVIVEPASPGFFDRLREPEREHISADAVFLLTGYRPDAALMRAAGIRCNEQTLAPELDPETFETNVPNLFIAGGASAGRNTGSIFIENGRFHGERIVKVLAERLAR
jgi:thioredoxin reductase (NADPH)